MPRNREQGWRMQSQEDKGTPVFIKMSGEPSKGPARLIVPDKDGKLTDSMNIPAEAVADATGSLKNKGFLRKEAEKLMGGKVGRTQIVANTRGAVKVSPDRKTDPLDAEKAEVESLLLNIKEWVLTEEDKRNPVKFAEMTEKIKTLRDEIRTIEGTKKEGLRPAPIPPPEEMSDLEIPPIGMVTSPEEQRLKHFMEAPRQPRIRIEPRSKESAGITRPLKLAVNLKPKRKLEVTKSQREKLLSLGYNTEQIEELDAKQAPDVIERLTMLHGRKRELAQKDALLGQLKKQKREKSDKIEELLERNIDGKNIPELQALGEEVRSYLTEDVDAHQASQLNDMIDDIELLIKEQRKGKPSVRPENYTHLVVPEGEVNKLKIGELIGTEVEGLSIEELEKILTKTRKLFNSAPTQEYKEKIIGFGEKVKAEMDKQKSEKIIEEVAEPRIMDPTPTQVDLKPIPEVEVVPVEETPQTVATPPERKIKIFTREQIDARTAFEIDAGIQKSIKGMSKEELQEHLLWIRDQFRWVGLGARQKLKIKLEKKEAVVEKALMKIPLADIAVGSVLMFKGKNFKVTEKPNKGNKERYKVMDENGLTIIRDPKTLSEMITSGEVTLTTTETTHTEATSTPEVKKGTWTPEKEARYQKLLKMSAEVTERLRVNGGKLLKLIEAEEAKDKKEKEAKETVEFFDTKFLENKLREILSSFDAVKSVDSLSITGSGDNLVFNGVMTAKISLPLIGDVGTTEVTFKDGKLINGFENIKLSSYALTATTGEGKVKKLMDKHIDSIGAKLKEFIEKEKGKKVSKIEIENGQLKVEYVKK